MVKTIPLPFLKKMSGRLGFDQENDRLFFSDGKNLVVVNADSGERVGFVPKVERIFDIAFAPETHRAFIVDAQGHLLALDLQTLAVPLTTKAGAESSSVVYDPSTKNVFTTGTSSKACKVFDGATNKVVKTLKLIGYPSRTVADSRGHIYFQLSSNDMTSPLPDLPGTVRPIPRNPSVVELDTRTWRMEDLWKSAACPLMDLIGIDSSGQNLVIACKSTVTLVDPQTQRVLASSSIEGIRGPIAVMFSRALGDAFFEGLDQRGRTEIAIAHEENGQFAPAVLAPQVAGAPAAFDATKQRLFVVQSDTKTADSGLLLTIPGGGPTPLRVQEAIPGTFRILVYGRD